MYIKLSTLRYAGVKFSLTPLLQYAPGVNENRNIVFIHPPGILQWLGVIINSPIILANPPSVILVCYNTPICNFTL